MSNNDSILTRIQLLLERIFDPSGNVHESLMAISLIIEKNCFVQHQSDNSVELFVDLDLRDFRLESDDLESIKAKLIEYMRESESPAPEVIYALSRFADDGVIKAIIDFVEEKEEKNRSIVLALLKNFSSTSLSKYKKYLETLLSVKDAEIVARVIIILKRIEIFSTSSNQT